MKAENKQQTGCSRRQFLGQASCAAITASPLLSTLFNLKMAGNLSAAPGEDYRALVCIFLAGGNDSFNMLIPTEASSYGGYTAARSNLALTRESILPLSGKDGAGHYGVHPGMPEVQSLYNSEKLAFVANVGTLVEPTNLAGFNNNSARLPVGLFSHSDQIMHWQTSIPDQRSPYGWAGRMADILHAENNTSPVSMNISLAGTNTFQSGQNSVSYDITQDGNCSVVMESFPGNETFAEISKTAVKSLMDIQYKNLFQKTFATINSRSIDAAQSFADAVSEISVKTAFSPTALSQSLKMVARTIGARKNLTTKRQTFFIMYGGWDHHDELLNSHAAMLPVVSKAMGEFDRSLTELGVSNQVTTFTASDFARTLSSNGRGSDHAWGSNQMVMGGAVRGGTVYGEYPDLTPKNPLDTGRGRLIPTTSTDEYFAELALWFGVQPGDLPSVFPNLNRFYTVGSENPIGFL